MEIEESIPQKRAAGNTESERRGTRVYVCAFVRVCVCACVGRGQKKNLHKRAAGNTDAINFREHVAYLCFV
jgi:hypothetical protein